MILTIKTLKIALSLQESTVLYNLNVKTEILCENNKTLQEKLEFITQNIDNESSISQCGEIIYDENVIVLKNAHNEVINVWRGANVAYLHNATSPNVIRLEIDSNALYLICNFRELLGIIKFLLETMLHCFEAQNNPTQRGQVIECLIDKLLEVERF